MWGSGIMLNCNGNGNNDEGPSHGGEGNAVGEATGIGDIAEVRVRCACCMCTLVGDVSAWTNRAEVHGFALGFRQNLPLSLVGGGVGMPGRGGKEC